MRIGGDETSCTVDGIWVCDSVVSCRGTTGGDAGAGDFGSIGRNAYVGSWWLEVFVDDSCLVRCGGSGSIGRGCEHAVSSV